MATKFVAILESMWDWRGMTSGAGYQKEEAPRSFRINPDNHSGRRLYKLCGSRANLRVTNACRELQRSPNDHGTPDSAWLKENLKLLEPFDVLLVCGNVAQQTYDVCGYTALRVLKVPHPAARMWTREMIADAQSAIGRLIANA